MSTDFEDISNVIRLYVEGAGEGDEDKLNRAFHPDARMFGESAGRRFDGPIGGFIRHAATGPGSGAYASRSALLHQVGDMAVAMIEEDDYQGRDFVDLFTLVRIDGRWLIVNKAFTDRGAAAR